MKLDGGISLFVKIMFAILVAVSVMAQPCEVPDDGTGTVSLPPEGCAYLSPQEVHMIIDGLPPGTTIELDPIHHQFLCVSAPPPHCGVPGGVLGGEIELFESILGFEVFGTGDLAGFQRTLQIPVICETHTGFRALGGPVQLFPTEMFRLEGGLVGDPDFDRLTLTGGLDYGFPGPGETTLVDLGGGLFNVDSFFDITYQIDFQGVPGSILEGLAGVTTATLRMETGEPWQPPPPGPCELPDDGTGTVSLPPEGCPYLSPQEVHMIIDGLPPGTTIELDPIHHDFICVGPPGAHCGTVGGGLGGEVEIFDSSLVFELQGTGSLAGWNRLVGVPVACETHTGPRNLGSSLQSFPTEMFQLMGNLFGDPDFDLLEVRAGQAYGLPPSPGQTTLTRLPTGDYNVDSFFDITYEIEFLGSPSGPLAGASGVTTATIRMRAGQHIDPPPPNVNPCQEPDDGTGTVNLPPQDCDYLSPREVHMIIDGLPPGTTIVLDPIHTDFMCGNPGPHCGRPGGGFPGGESEPFDSNLAFSLRGTGALAGFNRELLIPIVCETHTGPRSPSDPVQEFPNDMNSLQGGLPPGDPDFDMLDITGGTAFGLPSPGVTTLTQLPDGDFAVDSFFDITYRIDFFGAPGGQLDGLSGSTTATLRMQAGDCDNIKDFAPFWNDVPSVDILKMVSEVGLPLPCQ